MRKESMLTLVLSLAIAGSGGIILNQTIAGEQNKAIQKTVKNENSKSFDGEELEKAREKKEAKADDSQREVVVDDNTPDSDKKNIDMEGTEIANVIIPQVEKIYGELTKDMAIGINIREEDEISKRDYYGELKISNNEDDKYVFSASTITGELNYVYKYYKDLDVNKGADSSMEFGDEIEADSKAYLEVADKFATDYLEGKKIENKEVMVSTVFFGGDDNAQYIYATPAVQLTLNDGTKYTISIHPKTKVLVGFTVNTDSKK
ncbi:MAG: hypothetical protein E7254_00705 [Lachnospiraceae bacterium]|nr:hypothetical protein [Lachnospiraceae bacterium]